MGPLTLQLKQHIHVYIIIGLFVVDLQNTCALDVEYTQHKVHVYMCRDFSFRDDVHAIFKE